MSLTNAYLNEAEARDWAMRNETKPTDILEEVVNSASRLIDRYTGRHFYQVTATARIFDSEDGYCIHFGPFNDLVSVTTVKTDDNEDGTYETTRSATTYQLHPVGASTMGPAVWPYTSLHMLGGQTLPWLSTTGRRGLVEITGTWGWPGIPPEIKQACKLIASEMLKMQEAPLGVAGGDFSGVSFVRNQLPPRARDLLAPFRHPLNMGIA